MTATAPATTTLKHNYQWMWRQWKSRGVKCIDDVFREVEHGEVADFWETPDAPLLCMRMLHAPARPSEKHTLRMRWLVDGVKGPPTWDMAPTLQAYNTALRYFGRIASLDDADATLASMVEQKVHPNGMTYTEIIGLYCQHPDVCKEQALEVFQLLLQLQPAAVPDIVRGAANQITKMRTVSFSDARQVFNSLPAEVALNGSSFLSLFLALERDVRSDVAALAAEGGARDRGIPGAATATARGIDNTVIHGDHAAERTTARVGGDDAGGDQATPAGDPPPSPHDALAHRQWPRVTRLLASLREHRIPVTRDHYLAAHRIAALLFTPQRSEGIMRELQAAAASQRERGDIAAVWGRRAPEGGMQHRAAHA